MAKKEKPPLLSDYITAGEASQILSERLEREITNRYIHKLSTRKKHPIRAIPSGNRWLYHRGDLQTVDIRERPDNPAETAE